MEPQFFKADPKAIEESQRFKVLGWLALPGRGGSALKKDIDNAVVSEGDEVVVYEDHFEKKRGNAIEEIYFKDVTGIIFTKNPAGKLLFFHVSAGSADTVIVGMENMDGLLQSMSAHLPPSDIAQRVIGETFDGKAMMKRTIIGAVALFVLYLAMNLGINYYASQEAEKRLQSQPSTTAHIVLSLGDNESTTLSMIVPPEFVGGDQSGAGSIVPAFSLHKDTPNIGFYSEPATQDKLNSTAQQTILDGETQIHYADGNQITVNVATTTFLGYPGWVMTSKSDTSAKTILFQIGSSTNMIEIRIIYSPSDPADEQQQIDGILNSIKISTSSSGSD